MERNKNIYSWLMTATGVVAVGAALLIVLLADGSTGSRLALALIPLAVTALFSLLMNAVGRMGADRRRIVSKKMPPRPADPTGLRWVVAGAWSLMFALMWVAIVLAVCTGMSTWLGVVLTLIPVFGMGAVDIAVTARLLRAEGRPVTGTIVLYTLADLLDIAIDIFV